MLQSQQESSGQNDGLSSAYYVINAEDGGFVIVASDDRISNVLGFSENGNFDVSEMPENFRWLLNAYEEIINKLTQEDSAISFSNNSRDEITPMITTGWGQNSPYNNQCPSNVQRCVAGSVATAMAQVMNYYQWPMEATKAIPAYTSKTEGLSMPELVPTTFEWSNMTDEDVSRLILYCGQSVKMDYGTSASVARDLDVPSALREFFNYYGGVHRESRSNFTDEAWDELLYNEIHEGRPVLYSGTSGTDTQMFICHGYKNGMFYINWGCNGEFDGYYNLSLLNPSTDDYTQNQTAIIGIQKAIYNELDEDERTTYYTDQSNHLLYTLHLDTQEAILGVEVPNENDRYPALSSQGLDWNDNTNYWENVVVPSSVEYEGKKYPVIGVGPRAFYRTTYVKTVKLPETIQFIGAEAFNSCVYLESINIPSQVKKIESSTFSFCHFNLKSIHLPENIDTIGYGAFSDCRNLVEINIPGACKEIGEEAFCGCEKLSKLTIEDGVEPLKVGYTYNLPFYYQGDKEEEYRGLFGDCPISNLYLGRNIECPIINGEVMPPFYSIANYLTPTAGAQVQDGKDFSECKFGDNVTEIPDQMFRYSTFGEEIVLPPYLKKIGKSAFENTFGNGFSQYKISFPSSLQSVGAQAFDSFHNGFLRFVKCEATTPPKLSSLFWKQNLVVIVPAGCGPAYRNDAVWGQMNIIDPSDETITINVRTPGTLYSRLLAQDVQVNDVYKLRLKGALNSDDWDIVRSMNQLYELDLSELQDEELPSGMFAKNYRLSGIKLPMGLKRIEDNAFYQCYHLSGDLAIPSSCTEIGEKAFYDTAIETLTCPANVSIGEAAFSRCWNLKIPEIRFSGVGAKVCTSAFGEGILGYYNVTKINRVILGHGAVVESEAFGSHVDELVIEDGVEAIGTNAFETDTIIFYGIIKNLSENAFRSCMKVHSSSLDMWLSQSFASPTTNPTYMSHNLYVNNQEVSSIRIPASINRIPQNSFVNVESVTDVELHPNIIGIGESDFSGCCNLSKIQFSSDSKLETIGSNAFSGCSSLLALDFPLSINKIEEKAFTNCSSLKKVVAHWDEPFAIQSNTFSGVDADCYLYVPIGKATAYTKAGWNLVPNFKEAGILSVKANNGGTVNCYDTNITNTTEDVFFTPYRSFNINLIPDEGYVIKKVKLNGENVTSQVEDGVLFMEEPEENMNLSVIFADANIKTGDVNGDGIINVTDAICIVNHILKNKPEVFYDYAADANDDEVINITDAVTVVKLLIGNK